MNVFVLSFSEVGVNAVFSSMEKLEKTVREYCEETGEDFQEVMDDCNISVVPFYDE
jgi:hypothetical protein